MPHCSILVSAEACAEVAASGSDARYSASRPAGTTWGDSAFWAASDAASLLPAMPTWAVRPAFFLERGDQGAAEIAFRVVAGVVAVEAGGVEVGDAFAAVLHPRREALGDVEQGLAGGVFALRVARPGDQLGQAGARLGQGEAGADAGPPRPFGGRHHPRRVARAGDHHHRFLAQLGLERSRAASGKAAPPRRRPAAGCADRSAG